jgi:hypothetical protein
MAAAEPSLLPDLFTISQARMHLIALALAHLDTQVPPDIGLFARRSSRKVLDRVLGHAPAGIERALHRLPVAVLNRQNYRRLVNLLDDPESAKVLHHAAKISDSTIRVLYEMPGPLRRLSITHNFHPDDGAQFDVSEARQSAPHDRVSRRRVVGAGEITAEAGDFDQVVG